MKKSILFAAAALCAAQAGAQSEHGVAVYPGAKPAPEVAQALKKQFKVNGSTYRTDDSVAKVAEFYRKQPALQEGPGGSDRSAGFNGKGVMVTIQNPWADMKTGKVNTDTLVSIVKQK